MKKETSIEILGGAMFIVACMTIWVATLASTGYSAVTALVGIMEVFCAIYMFFKAESMRIEHD